MNSLRDKTAVVGVGTTNYFKRGESVPATPMDLAVSAIRAAAADAGIDVKEIDGFAMYAGGLASNTLSHQLGLENVRYTATLPGGGGGSAGSVGLAASAITSGLASVVVSVMVLQQAKYRLGQAGGKDSPYAIQYTPETDFALPFGMVSPGHKYAMAASRHMHLYGTKREHFAEVAMSTRENALTRPKALMKKPMTLDDYFNARMIADPLCLFDFCLESDGAVAIITTSTDRARDLAQPPVLIHSAAFGGDGVNSTQIPWANSPDEYFVSGYSERVAKNLYATSDLGPSDIDVAQLYDHFGPMVLFQLEDYGFCARGESGEFVAEGNIRFNGGSLPVNTHGGHLSEAYVMGMTHLVEGVEQVRGTAINQVADAKTALVSGGPASIPMSAVIFRKDD